MPAQRCNTSKLGAFVRLYVCYKYKNNHLYQVSKEDIKWLSYLGVEHYSSRVNQSFREKLIKLTE